MDVTLDGMQILKGLPQSANACDEIERMPHSSVI